MRIPRHDTTGGDFTERARRFCESAPHRQPPYNKRNWGGVLHSLCSYQGKLKPAIAHFLVSDFTLPGERVLDPMSGVGTIPMEARLQGRLAVANDLSPLAFAVSRAKLDLFDETRVWERFSEVERALGSNGPVNYSDAEFGLNGPISSYFHPETLRELLAVRALFLAKRQAKGLDAADAAVLTALLHILHGNRPYALSRRSHPITPLAPSGPTEYKSVAGHLKTRLERVIPPLQALSDGGIPGQALGLDFRDLPDHIAPVDAVITSPPFSSSLRFWSSNWMRLWLAGWSPSDFRAEPPKYIESEQRKTFAPYREFGRSMAGLLRRDGRLIMHLGETPAGNMVEGVMPQLSEYFEIKHIGRECVQDNETHGLRDKGATTAHWYLFATRR